MDSYLNLANDFGLWLICIPTVVLVGIQAVLFSQRAIKASAITQLSPHQCRQAMKVGAISAIGPSLSVFVVMVAMMAVVGGPVTWLRLSIIGAAPTELTASTVGAEAMGVAFGSPGYGAVQFANSVWIMGLNGCGWLLFCGLFTHKLEVIQEKVAGGDPEMMQKICGGAVLGTASFLVVNSSKGSLDKVSAAFVAALSMILLNHLAKKIPALREYNLGIAMVLGMVIGVFVKTTLAK